MAPTETFSERIKRFDLEFTFVLIGLLKQINEISYENPNSKLINLVHRYVLYIHLVLVLYSTFCSSVPNAFTLAPPTA